MVAGRCAALAAARAVVAVGVGIAVVMQMLVAVGMLVRMFVSVDVLVGVGHTVVGVLMGMRMLVLVNMVTAGNMIVMKMHSEFSFRHFSLIITGYGCIVKFPFAEKQKPQVRTCGSATRKEEKKMKKRIS